MHQVFADQEVVASAGVFGTPQLLQLSGIGPAEHLRQVGVAPILDHPRIGTGLTDHPHAWSIWKPTEEFTGLADLTNPKWLLQYLFRRSGKLANTGVEAVAHIRTSADLPAADMQVMIVPADALADSASKLQPTVSIGHSYWTPKSKGEVMIRSSDPSIAPTIKLNMFSDPSDMAALKRGIARTRDIMATEPMRSAIERELLPGPGTDFEKSIRATAITTYHASCSVAMGADEDSPLDDKLRVRGVDNLRVADASALPCIPRANTSAPSIRLGERCADFLLARHS